MTDRALDEQLRCLHEKIHHLGSMALEQVTFEMLVSFHSEIDAVKLWSEAEMAAKKACTCEVTAVDSGTLTIVSRKTPVLIKHQNTSKHQQLAQKLSWFVENIKSRNAQTLPFYPDIQLDNGEFQEGMIYYYVEIACFDHHSAAQQAGLIVRPRKTENSGEQHELYERVGMAGDISCNLENISPRWLTGEERDRINLI